MKKGIKRLCAVLLSALLLCGFLGVPALADGEDVREEETLSGAGKTGGKEEVVYATLGADGSVSGVYVVNVLEVAFLPGRLPVTATMQRSKTSPIWNRSPVKTAW